MSFFCSEDGEFGGAFDLLCDTGVCSAELALELMAIAKVSIL